MTRGDNGTCAESLGDVNTNRHYRVLLSRMRALCCVQWRRERAGICCEGVGWQEAKHTGRADFVQHGREDGESLRLSFAIKVDTKWKIWIIAFRFCAPNIFAVNCCNDNVEQVWFFSVYTFVRIAMRQVTQTKSVGTDASAFIHYRLCRSSKL